MSERDPELRGRCIASIRTNLQARHDVNPLTRKLTRLNVLFAIRHLRELGPGEVEMPSDAIGPAIDWIGCDSCDGSGMREFNSDGADVMGFCGFCARGVALEHQNMREHGFGWLIPKRVA